MKYTVLTLFPEITDAYFSTSIMAKAVERGIISYRAVNIRDFALDRHKTCDDAPYGGGPGMLMLPEPLSRALESVGVKKEGRNSSRRDAEGAEGRGKGREEGVQRESGTKIEDAKRVIYLTPSGRPFTRSLRGNLRWNRSLCFCAGAMRVLING